MCEAKSVGKREKAGEAFVKGKWICFLRCEAWEEAEKASSTRETIRGRARFAMRDVAVRHYVQRGPRPPKQASR